MSPTPAAASSPAQLRALLKRWQESLELHTRYLALDNQRYQHVQPWPRHERPARWIVELARQKIRVLTRFVEQRSKVGDQTFIEALELMGFLSTLVGLSNVERFVPLCDAASERREVLNATPPPADDHTREMPQLTPGHIGRMLQEQRSGVPYPPAQEARRAAASDKKRSGDAGVHTTRSIRAAASKLAPVARSATPAARAAAPAARAAIPASRAAVAPRAAAPTGIEAAVVDDALRLMGWGRQWHELPEIIARLADRPSPTQIRRVLREQRGLIERRHAAGQI